MLNTTVRGKPERKFATAYVMKANKGSPMTNNTTPPKRSKGRPKKNKTSPEHLQMIADIDRAWQLRMEGKTYREIGAIMGVHFTTVHDYIQKKILHHENSTDLNHMAYRDQQLDDIEKAIAELWKQYRLLSALNQNNTKIGDNIQLARARADTLRTLQTFLDRQSKLLGLDEPTRIENLEKQISFVMDLTGETHDPSRDD
jgi:hypothetical protein